VKLDVRQRDSQRLHSATETAVATQSAYALERRYEGRWVLPILGPYARSGPSPRPLV
jgi:hypothetical protein